MQKLQNCWSALYKAELFAAEQAIRYKMNMMSSVISDSAVLQTTLLSNTGRLLETFALEPFLCITVISAVFQSYSNVAVSVDNLNRHVSGATISFLTSNRTLRVHLVQSRRFVCFYGISL